MLMMYFTEIEFRALEEVVLERVNRPETTETEIRFWAGLAYKLTTIAKYPMCVWCDSHAWDLDNPDSAIYSLEDDIPEH